MNTEEEKQPTKRGKVSSSDSTQTISAGTHNSLPKEVSNALSTLHVIHQSLRDINLRLDKYDNISRSKQQINSELWDIEGFDERITYNGQQDCNNEGKIKRIRNENKKPRREIDLLKSVVIRLDRKVSSQEEEILDLRGRSMRDNILIHHYKELKGENLFTSIQEAIKNI